MSFAIATFTELSPEEWDEISFHDWKSILNRKFGGKAPEYFWYDLWDMGLTVDQAIREYKENRD